MASTASSAAPTGNQATRMHEALRFVDRVLSERATYGTRAKPTVSELNEILRIVRAALEA